MNIIKKRPNLEMRNNTFNLLTKIINYYDKDLNDKYILFIENSALHYSISHNNNNFNTDLYYSSRINLLIKYVDTKEKLEKLVKNFNIDVSTNEKIIKSLKSFFNVKDFMLDKNNYDKINEIITKEKGKKFKFVSSNSNVCCRICKSNNVSYETKQVRKADEGSTIFYTCLDCGNAWNKNT